ncbi:52 kDa repressor of the inhibitor of the protein kinase-like [Macrobrachium rosenbergii]|uniref:52 kDa repressor of the inhibitor of the protein kinase-like n=1 Tax=Macrobrachium rosenbergii TaxID=79674 RepID=UPI0034D407E9
MPSNCSIFGCFNTKAKTKETGVRHFRFPKDEVFRDKWLHACRRADPVNPKNAVICSVHFTLQDYAEDLKSRLLDTESPRNKRALKENAVPSLNLPNGVAPAKSSVARDGRAHKRSERKAVKELCDMSKEDIGEIVADNARETTQDDCVENDVGESSSPVVITVIPVEVTNELQRLKNEVKQLREENESLRTEIADLRGNVVQIIRNVVIARTEKILSPYFSRTQIKAIITQKKSQ